MLHGVAVFVHSYDHRRLGAAMANCLEFLEVVTPGQQIFTTFERLPLEIGPQAIGQHGNIQLVGDFAELEHLFLGQELRLID